MQKKWVRILLWCLTIAMCVTIFVLSSEDGTQSMQTSGRFAEPIARLIASGRPPMTQSEFMALVDEVQVYVRKAAHFSEYAVLAVLVYLLSIAHAWRLPARIAIGFSGLYAAGDELHQLLSGSRTGMWQDVLLDTCGAAFGTLGIFLILKALHSAVLHRQRRLQEISQKAEAESA